MTEPIELSDLVRKTKLINIGDGRHLKIQGLTAREIFEHLDRFQLLKKVAIGGRIEMLEALTETPAALAAWVASAAGHHGDPDAERIVDENMTIELSSEIAEASLALTFSKGFGPFEGRAVAILGFISAGRGQAPATPSPAPSRPSTARPTQDPGTSPPANSKPASSSTNSDEKSSEPT